jgi:hypothetical protein
MGLAAQYPAEREDACVRLLTNGACTMAKVWPVYDGRDPTREPWAVLPLKDASRVLDLEPRHFLADLSHSPKFGDVERDLWWLGFRHVVVEVGRGEAKDLWRPGFYKSPLLPEEAFFRLRVHQRLGDRWRDEWEKGRDAHGEPALWLWLVLKSSAPESEWERENRNRILAELRNAAVEIGVPDWVFIRFRKEKEDELEQAQEEEESAAS